MHHTGARPILWPKKPPSWWVLNTLNDFVNDKECHQGSRSMRSVNSFHADNMTARRYYFEAPHIQCMQGLHFLHVLCPHVHIAFFIYNRAKLRTILPAF